MTKIFRVTFQLKKHHPSNLKEVEYFVETDDQAIAHEKALKQLNYDLGVLSLKLRSSGKELLRYYDKFSITEIDVIK